MSNTTSATDNYYIPHEGSIWPVVGVIGLLLLTVGFSMFLNDAPVGSWMMIGGAAVIIFMMFRWFGDVIRESLTGLYSKQMDMTFRWSMSWFIFSEIMFFAAFFGALYYARMFAVPWIGGEGNNFSTNLYIWQGFEAIWPTNGPGNLGGDYQVMGPWGLPLANTLILLTSGVTLTVAHWGLFDKKYWQVVLGLAATVTLGVIFLFLQAEEYIHAYQEMNLTLGSGIYGSTFFLLTGFHGMHVTLGTIMLIVALVRAIKSHFTPENHFAFEAIAWYWHFVDVVWLGLFIFVYIL